MDPLLLDDARACSDGPLMSDFKDRSAWLSTATSLGSPDREDDATGPAEIVRKTRASKRDDVRGSAIAGSNGAEASKPRSSGLEWN